ncbi:hypothetical protein [Streptomyces xanthophaeus]
MPNDAEPVAVREVGKLALQDRGEVVGVTGVRPPYADGVGPAGGSQGRQSIEHVRRTTAVRGLEKVTPPGQVCSSRSRCAISITKAEGPRDIQYSFLVSHPGPMIMVDSARVRAT